MSTQFLTKYGKIITAICASIGSVSIFIISCSYAYGRGQSKMEHRVEKIEFKLEQNSVAAEKLEGQLMGIQNELTRLNTNLEWIMRENKSKGGN